ncbi:uncharacterized protein LOC106013686 [Aplysia californica]|uniref:Uncharacterized protein LOC106013686 n=1 Tax=Aplysia californica TaxID=6500 RepID=A0ABM1ADD0_APLCA|nr:uncharacterized protein LOC106013686 [Aplysia californica]
MASSLARYRRILKPTAETVRCTYTESLEDTEADRYPTFTKNLYFSIFPPPVADHRLDDDRECDHTDLLKPLGHLGSGRLGKTCTAMRKDMTPYPCSVVPKPDIRRVVAVTKMDSNQVDYIDAVRALEPFSLSDKIRSPFLCRVLLSFRSKQPFQIGSDSGEGAQRGFKDSDGGLQMRMEIRGRCGLLIRNSN